MLIKNLSSNKGIALLTITVMLSGLIGLVAVCAFVMGNEADDDARYDETRERMLEVKRALIGRLADVGGGEDITSCGGFISDYGEPNNMDPFTLSNRNFIGVLLNRRSMPAWTNWSYSGVPNEFWTGYRGESYIIPPAGEWDDDPPYPHDFYDGWGYPIEVVFIQDTNTPPEYTVINIRSTGSNGMSGGSGNYAEDVEDVFYWRRGLSVNARITTTEPLFSGRNVSIRVQLIYSRHGIVNLPLPEDANAVAIDGSGNGTGNFVFVGNFPVGLRKIVFLLDENIPPYSIGDVLTVEVFCIPPMQAAIVAPPPPSPYALDMDVRI